MPRKKLLKRNRSEKKKEKTGKKRYSNKLSRDELINAESAIGRTLFGPIPEGHQREFFESRKNVWIWHEGFFNNLGDWNEMTIRYEVRPTGVYKRIDRGNYNRIEGEELNNFRRAAKTYLALVKSKLYC